MTECERIIKQGILPESFFKEEIRCEYRVTKERKKIWAIELDLYLKFASVCEKYNLRYFLLFGSLLGAIRHKGMIPWDDDIDVCMPREDYEKFCNICVSEFEKPYLLQTPYTDKGYFYSFAKIRNRNTTCMPEVMSKGGFCHGIFLDVFPLDFVNISNYETDRENIFKSIMRCSSYMKRNNDLNTIQLEKQKLYHTDIPLLEYENIQKIATNPNYAESDYLGVPVNTILKSYQLIWKASDFSSYVLCPFEGFEVRIPVGYDDILCTTYGDYMAYPPINKRGLWHSDIIWNPDKAYTEFIE